MCSDFFFLKTSRAAEFFVCVAGSGWMMLVGQPKENYSSLNVKEKRCDTMEVASVDRYLQIALMRRK